MLKSFILTHFSLKKVKHCISFFDNINLLGYSMTATIKETGITIKLFSFIDKLEILLK